MRLLLGLVLFLLSCSPPPPPMRCVGGLTQPVRTPLHFENDTVLHLAVAGPSCALPGVLSVIPTLEDATGTEVPPTVAKLVESNVGIEVELSVPPLAAGTYELRLFIEPALAVVDTQVLVARREKRAITTTLPAPCREPARTFAGTTFCRAEQGFTAFSDAGQQSFPLTTSVAATHDVVWMIEGTMGVRRLVDRGAGQLEQTGTWQFGSISIPKLTTCDEQTVFVDDRRFDAAPDGGLKPISSSKGPLPLLEQSGVAQLTSTGWCTAAVCQERLGQLVAVDDDALWFAVTPLGAAPPNFTALALAERPLKKTDAGVSLALPLGFQPLVRAFPFQIVGEAPALLVSLPDAGPPTLVKLRHGPGGTRATAYSETVVLGATREWLFTPGDNANELKAYPLTP